jgi:hypothetical protein
MNDQHYENSTKDNKQEKFLFTSADTQKLTPFSKDPIPEKLITYVTHAENETIENTDGLEGYLKITLHDALQKDFENKEEEAKADNSLQNQKAQEAYQKRLQDYYRKVIEAENKTAHERAVELGQFINLFF